jgi:catechol 2,3-dioxygenase
MSEQGNITPVQKAPNPIDPGVRIGQTADHGTHEAIYITDPDGNDVELMWDRPVERWPRDEQGHLIGQFGDGLDLDELLRELD